MSDDAEQVGLDEVVEEYAEGGNEHEDIVRGKILPTEWDSVVLDEVSEKMKDGGTPDRTGENDYFGGI